MGVNMNRRLVFAAGMAMFLCGFFLAYCKSNPKLTPEEVEKLEEATSNYRLIIPLPLTQELEFELAGSEAIKKTGLKSVAGMDVANPEFERLMLKAGVVASNLFSDWIGFSRIDQTKDACGYAVLTFKDNTVVTGKYTMQATLRKDYTGGPGSFATENYIEVNELKLAQRTVRPGKKVFESPRVVVPGERITRMISPKESAVDDTYQIDFGLPPNTKVWVDFYGDEKVPPEPLADSNADSYFKLNLTNAAGIHIPFETFNSNDFFQTRDVGKYLLRITAKMRADNRPDRYILEIVFGELLGGDTYDNSRVKWSAGRKYLTGNKYVLEK